MQIKKIQELRGLAALLVTITHLNHFLGIYKSFNGSIGVDIFFIISGFIMNHVIKNNNYTFKDFLIKRFSRIYPLYFNVTIFVFSILFFVSPEKDLIFKFLRSILLIPFDNSIHWKDFLIVPGWSLFFEIIFYLVVSLGLLFSKRNILFVLFIWAFLIALNYLFSSPLILNYFFSTIYLEFIFGYLLYEFFNLFKFKSNYFILILYATFVLLMFISTDENITINLPRDGILCFGKIHYRFILWGIPSFIFVLSYLYFDKFESNHLIKLGDLSYSLYLIQFFVIGAWSKLFQIFQVDVYSMNIMTKTFAFLVVLVSILVFSKLSNKYLERKIVFNLFRKNTIFLR